MVSGNGTNLLLSFKLLGEYIYVVLVGKIQNTLKLTDIAPENGWLEYDRFLLEWTVFRCELLFQGPKWLSEFFSGKCRYR